jgi:hypothetical protein
VVTTRSYDASMRRCTTELEEARREIAQLKGLVDYWQDLANGQAREEIRRWEEKLKQRKTTLAIAFERIEATPLSLRSSMADHPGPIWLVMLRFNEEWVDSLEFEVGYVWQPDNEGPFNSYLWPRHATRSGLNSFTELVRNGFQVYLKQKVEWRYPDHSAFIHEEGERAPNEIVFGESPSREES